MRRRQTTSQRRAAGRRTKAMSNNLRTSTVLPTVIFATLCETSATWHSQVAVTTSWAAMPNIKLYPGMPATVMIPTVQRTAFDYIVGPLVMSFNHSFRQK